MNLRKLLGVVLLGLGIATAAHAQAGIYVGYAANQLSGITCFDPQHLCSSANGKVNPSGVTFGGYYDFRTVGPVLLGIDVRGGDLHSNKSASSSAGDKNITGYDNVLVGVKGSIHTRYSWLNPYAQLSFGYARSNATEPVLGTLSNLGNPLPRTEDNFFQYEAFLGLTVHVFSMIDLRPVELGIGEMNRFGSGNGPGSVGVKTIGAAIVFHTPSK